MTVTAAHWEPLTRESVKATQALVEDVTGLTELIFRCSTYLAQRDSGAFTEADPAERMDVLARTALGPKPVWPSLLDQVRADQRELTAELARVGARLEQAEQELAEKRRLVIEQADAGRAVGGIASLLSRAEANLEALTEQWQQAEKRASERRAAEAEHAAAVNERERLREQAAAAEAARDSIAATTEALARLATPEQLAAAEQAYSEARAAYDRQAFERQTLEAKLADAQENEESFCVDAAVLTDRLDAVHLAIRALDSDPWEPCALCKRPLEDEASRQAVYASYTTDADAITDQLVAAGEQVRDARNLQTALREQIAALGVAVAPDDADARRLRSEVTERARLEERIAAWQQAVDVVEQPTFLGVRAFTEKGVQDALQRLAALPPIDQAELDRIKQQGLEARAQVNEQRQRLDEAREQKARFEEKLERLQAVERQAAADRADMQKLHKRLDTLGVLERAYHHTGVPAHIVENVAIPVIETEANRILLGLGTPYRVELRTLRETLKGELRPTLDIVVVDQNGAEDEYVGFSGGEATRVAITLRVAFAIYMQLQGFGSDMLIIDEPEGLDDAGMAALGRVVQGLVDRGVFRRALLVSHGAVLRDSFDQVITVVREDGVSRVETAAAAVAA